MPELQPAMPDSDAMPIGLIVWSVGTHGLAGRLACPLPGIAKWRGIDAIVRSLAPRAFPPT